MVIPKICCARNPPERSSGEISAIGDGEILANFCRFSSNGWKYFHEKILDIFHSEFRCCNSGAGGPKNIGGWVHRDVPPGRAGHEREEGEVL